MNAPPPPEASTAIVRADGRVRFPSRLKRRSVSSAPAKHWQPPEGFTAEQALAVIAAGTTERDRLLLRVLWLTGARVSEVLALRPMDVERDALVLPNLKNPSRKTKRVYLPAGEADLPGTLLLWAREQGLPDTAQVFSSRNRAGDGGLRPLTRLQVWRIVKAASRRANVQVLALRDSKDGKAGEPAPIHPHLFRHARIRQTLRTSKSLPLVQRQAGWSRLQMAYLTMGDEEARELMRDVAE